MLEQRRRHAARVHIEVCNQHLCNGRQWGRIPVKVWPAIQAGGSKNHSRWTFPPRRRPTRNRLEVASLLRFLRLRLRCGKGRCQKSRSPRRCIRAVTVVAVRSRCAMMLSVRAKGAFAHTRHSVIRGASADQRGAFHHRQTGCGETLPRSLSWLAPALLGTLKASGRAAP